MKILIIEDNELIAKTLERSLRNDYQIDLTNNGDDGLFKGLNFSYDLILLDLNLPDLQGDEICRKLRQSNVSTPIIVASGKDSITDKIEMFKIGADDYLVKPFNLEELKIRITVALRHVVNKAPTGKIIIDDLVLDPYTREVLHCNVPIVLRKKEYDLLAYLMYNQGQILTRNMIMEHIWSSQENLWANVIDVHIKHIRDKIDRPYNTNLIKTVHGLGYKIEAKF